MPIKTSKGLSDVIARWAEKETRAMQNDLYTSVKAETPVDTGTAQRGWTTKDITTLGDTGVIENLVPYIGWLEFGSDTAAPVAMVRRNIKRVTK